MIIMFSQAFFTLNLLTSCLPASSRILPSAARWGFLALDGRFCNIWTASSSVETGPSAEDNISPNISA